MSAHPAPTSRFRARGRYEEYHPYGSTSWHAEKSGIEVSRKRYRYTGKEKDEETGLYYHGARYYAPWLGRWTSADPAGMADGTTPYSYAGNSPIMARDSSGLSPDGPEDVPVESQATPPQPEDPLSLEALERLKPGERVTRPAGAEAKSLAESVTKGVLSEPTAASLPGPQLLGDIAVVLRSRTLRTGRESGAIYFVTTEGTEGVILTGPGSERTMGRRIALARAYLPENVAVDAELHAHPAQPAETAEAVQSYRGLPSGPLTGDIPAFLQQSGAVSIVTSEVSGPPQNLPGGQVSGPGMILLVRTRASASAMELAGETTELVPMKERYQPYAEREDALRSLALVGERRGFAVFIAGPTGQFNRVTARQSP